MIAQIIVDGYVPIAIATAVGLIGIDWWQLHTGRTVRYRHVPHRKLRAVTPTVLRGSVAPPLDAEPPSPTPVNLAVPGAGGLKHRATTAPTTPSGAPRPHVGGGPAPTSAAVVVTPDSTAAADSHPGGRGSAGTLVEPSVPARDVSMHSDIETRSRDVA